MPVNLSGVSTQGTQVGSGGGDSQVFQRVFHSLHCTAHTHHDLQEDPRTNLHGIGPTPVKYHSKNRERGSQNTCQHLVFESQGSEAWPGGSRFKMMPVAEGGEEQTSLLSLLPSGPGS